eukprot:TRINITY_DN1926_c0_g1_i1.p1 TRINITY_DN1926_c0_g1~~TRINITY_DN1926_c0_g1_i1.p1  ORF type:complete len:580 (+),score=177.47 TRINITY_DN1926_c0_g1_i1:45-1784(+)
MDVIGSIRDYVLRCVSAAQGMKALIMDEDTAGMVSMVVSQSSLLQREVFLFERIDQRREQMLHLKAVVILRPSRQNISLLVEELKEPKYAEYHLVFTNVLSNSHLEELARADSANEVVKSVQEAFIDYYAVNSSLFDLRLPGVLSRQQPDALTAVDRIVDGLGAVLLSIKKRPVIRFQKNSELASDIARRLAVRIQQEEPDLFGFRGASPLLLIIDRKTDPITPLLSQWTYQAMVHELVGITKNRVDLGSLNSSLQADLKEIVISPESDEFYKQSMFYDFGDLGAAIKELVDGYQNQLKDKQSLQSIEDIKRFVESYPEFRKASSTVNKHVTIMSELSKIVERRKLMTIGELEQKIACHSDASYTFQKLTEYLQDPTIQEQDKLRLACLYCLRFEDAQTHTIGQLLLRAGLDPSSVEAMNKLLKYAGANARGVNIFGDGSIFSKLSKSIKKGLAGVQNIFTEHKPYLQQILSDAVNLKLKEDKYPFITNASKDKPQEIIVFIVGGATYEEACCIADINSKCEAGSASAASSSTSPAAASSSSSSSSTFPPGTLILLGGTEILNSKSFLENAKKIELERR